MTSTSTLLPLSTMPPVDGARPLVGHATEFRSDRYTLFQRVADEQENVSLLRILGLPVVCASGPDAIREVLVDKARSFAKTVGIRMVVYPLAGDGLFTSDGELWRRQRKLMAPLFSPAHVDGYVPGIVACVRRWLDERRDGEVLDVGHEMTRITMNVVSRALFGIDTDAEADELGAAIEVVLADISRQAGTLGLIVKMQALDGLEHLEGRLPGPAERARAALVDLLRHPLPLPTAGSRRLRAAIATLDRLVDRMIAARRAAGLAAPDLLSRLLAARDEDDGATMSDRQVRDETLTMFFAGHETTAVALTWALYLLATHPDVDARLGEEVAALGDAPLGPESLPRLPYTLRVVKETLRLYPPAFMFDRIAKEDVEIGGYAVPRGTNVFMFPYALHRREDLWPDAARFDPDRFLPEAEKERPRLAWLPFGAGPRVCIGMHFALAEAQLALALMKRHMRLTLEPGQDVRPGNLATLRPAEPLQMRVALRR